MKIAIVGDNLAGLTCAYELQKAGLEVDVFSTNEKDNEVFFNSAKKLKQLATEFDLNWSEKNQSIDLELNGKKSSFTYNNTLSFLTVNGLGLASKIKLVQLIRKIRFDDNSLYDLNVSDDGDAFEFVLKHTDDDVAEFFNQFCKGYINKALKGMSLSLFKGLIADMYSDYSSLHQFELNGDLNEELKKVLQIKNSVQAVKVLKTKINVLGEDKNSYDVVVFASRANKVLKYFENPDSFTRSYFNSINNNYYPGFVKATKNFLAMAQNERVFFVGEYLNTPFLEGQVTIGTRVANKIINSQ